MKIMEKEAASSGTLFHFTKSLENLIGILEKDFLPRYCLEEMSVSGAIDRSGKDSMAFPMVCFCDIPLSRLREHLDLYGGYGIGLTKEWGMLKGISPVTYVHEESGSYRVFQGIWDKLRELNDLREKDSQNNKKRFDSFEELVEFASYMKPCEGHMFRDGGFVQKNFYEEREWRYVPHLVGKSFEKNSKVLVRLTKEDYLDSIKLELANRVLGFSEKLDFSPPDIRYLFVRNESEILPFVKSVEGIKGTKYSPNTVRLLTTRIMSSDRISLDF